MTSDWRALMKQGRSTLCSKAKNTAGYTHKLCYGKTGKGKSRKRPDCTCPCHLQENAHAQ